MNIRPLTNYTSRTRSGFMIATADLLGITTSLLATHLLGIYQKELLTIPEIINQSISLLVILPLLYLSYGLYPGVGISPVEELERVTKSTSLGFLLISSLSLWFQSSPFFSHPIIITTCLATIVMVQLARWLTRIIGTQTGIWGEPVIVIGDGPRTSWVVNYLLERKRLGFIPVIILEATGQNLTAPIPTIHLDNFYSTSHFSQIGVHTAFIVMRENPSPELKLIAQGKTFDFSRYILVSNSEWMGSSGIIPRDLEGMLGLEIRQNLLSPSFRVVKTLLDYFLIISTAMLVAPLIALIAIGVRIDSRGPIFHRSERLGKNGKRIHALKFRTMIDDSDRILLDHLDQHPELKAEWNTYRKLRGNDPRVTRLGAFLRKTSLDEIPQLWNVLKREMSLVGPRPILPSEEGIYGQLIAEYSQVLPGITGLWQVSGRNQTTFAQRTMFDEYYLRNWSIWLDIYILLRTILVVIRRHGAY